MLSLMIYTLFNIHIVASRKLIPSCDQGDTEWNIHLVGYYLKYWIDSIDVEKIKSSYDFKVEFKYKVKPPKSIEEETRLDFIAKLDHITGKTIGPAWKNFGYKGPRYHDGYLYGKVDENQQFTGIFGYSAFRKNLVFFCHL